MLRGLFIGDDEECFKAAAKLSLEVNFTLVPRPIDKVRVERYLEEPIISFEGWIDLSGNHGLMPVN